MFIDAKTNLFVPCRYFFAKIVVPLQHVAEMPVDVARSVGSAFSSKQKLLMENKNLRTNELILEAKLKKMFALERDNLQLKKLLKSSGDVSGKVLVTQMLAISLDPALRQIIINAGANDGVYIGQPVLDGYGILGQVVAVDQSTSKVLLINDVHSAVPVVDTRSDIRGESIGTNSPNSLNVIDIGDQGDVKVGDVFAASGLGLRYPVGYPVGIVSNIIRGDDNKIKQVVLDPTAHFHQSVQVLLAWPTKASFYKSANQLLKKKIAHLFVSSSRSFGNRRMA